VDFLRIWHEQQELADRLARCPSDSPARSYLENANRLMLTGPNLRHELFRRDLDLAGPGQCDDIALEKARTVANSGEAADLLRLGRILKARKEWEEAIQFFTVVVDGDQAHSAELIAWALVSRGVAQGQAGRAAEAIADYTRAIELPGAPPERVALALVCRGGARGRAGRTAEAIADYTRAIELPNAPPERVALALFSRSDANGKAGRTAEAIADCTRAIELPGASPALVAWVLLDRGHRHATSGRTAEAIADYTRAIELPGAPPNNIAIAHVMRGDAHFRAGQTAEEIFEYTRAIELPEAPSEVIAWALVMRAGAHLKAGRTSDAIADYTRAIELPGAAPEHVVSALVDRGTTHLKAGRTAEAIADFTRVIDLPDAPPLQLAKALNNRVVCYGKQAQHDAVLQDLVQLFTLSDEKAAQDAMADRFHHLARKVVTAVFAGTTDPARWVQLLTEFTGHFARFGGLTGLGEAAVKHLPAIGTSPLNHAAWDAWANAWESARAALPPEHRDQLDIPLRLLRAGIAWLKSKDDAHLLTLPREERRILREALELPAEKI